MILNGRITFVTTYFMMIVPSNDLIKCAIQSSSMHNGVCYYTRFMFSIEYVMYVLCWVYHQFMIVFLQLGCFVYMVWLVHACHEQYRLGGEIKMKAFK